MGTSSSNCGCCLCCHVGDRSVDKRQRPASFWLSVWRLNTRRNHHHYELLLPRNCIYTFMCGTLQWYFVWRLKWHGGSSCMCIICYCLRWYLGCFIASDVSCSVAGTGLRSWTCYNMASLRNDSGGWTRSVWCEAADGLAICVCSQCVVRRWRNTGRRPSVHSTAIFSMCSVSNLYCSAKV